MADPDELLTRVLSAANVQGTHLGPDDLRRIWELIAPGDEAGFDEFAAAVVQVCAAEWPGGAPPDELGLRLGRWRIDLTRAGIRTGLLTAVMGAVLVDRGMTEFGIAFVTAVLPTVLDIERVELSPGQQRLLADLRLKPALTSGFASEDELYAALPAHARQTVNRYDFADFVQQLRDAGVVEEGRDGVIRIRAADE